MKKTLLLSTAVLTLAGTVALLTHSVDASTYSYYSTSHFLRQDGRETLREAKYAAELQIRNLLSQYHINGKEYNNYFRYYYRQARNIDEVNKIIEDLEKNLQAQ
ncbi:TPA: hypothetical protein ACGOIO_001332 [Streptococcus pyogenes]|uniref:hypothetical protein n=1 Tax=Streptococcus pyogenes TaxID=1314 RepID=UPI0010A14EC8|nr:hypothetical protein [Streptococcus pyogenes]VGS27660.1 Uncharacterised protein [Streptococcus pyogenes]VGS32183.1 Uncharacterised protein [Streptococcus pyogenes]VGT36466.1 Uncharacterised protein [Streptococcus pyogenes]HEP1653639.1 hypothetical protein [Streptococcus pyogenes]HEP2429466.1 hypothetical protein [Streptococcus pyogenes]